MLLFNPLLLGIRTFIPFLRSQIERDHRSLSGVRTRFLRCFSLVRYPLHYGNSHWDFSWPNIFLYTWVACEDHVLVSFFLLICLFVWVLWHINLRRLYNANSFLYRKTILFQSTQFSISTQFNCQQHFYFKLFSFVKLFYFKQFSLV